MKVIARTVYMTEAEYREGDDNMEGVCLECGETRSACEPDAQHYDCPACRGRNVFGFEHLMVAGRIVLVDHDGSDR